MSERAPGEAALVRHAETEWSREGRHTGLTDVPLTDRGREEAAALGGRMAGQRFALVLVSPSKRARETCELCGLGAEAQVRADPHEWDYGEYQSDDRSDRSVTQMPTTVSPCNNSVSAPAMRPSATGCFAPAVQLRTTQNSRTRSRRYP